MTFDQTEFDIRCEWGERGVAALAPISDAIIIVDVMSFSTCVSVVVSRGASVYPHRWKDGSSIAFAHSLQAEIAGPRRHGGFSLSPASLAGIAAGTRLVLPSPNGSTLSLTTGSTPTFAGCLRNAKAVASAAGQCGGRVSVIPAGERWKADGSLRPAIEDLIGAGAIIQHHEGRPSPEALIALKVFRSVKEDLLAVLRTCSSGKELIEMGFEQDIPLIAQIDADDHAPVLVDGAYIRARVSAEPPA